MVAIALSIGVSLVSAVVAAWHVALTHLENKILDAAQIKRLEALESKYAELLADARREGAKEALTKAYKR